MRKIDRRIVIVAGLIFIVGMAYGLMRYLISIKEEARVMPTREARRLVRAAPVAYRTLNFVVSEPGRLLSVSRVSIVAEASGRIQQGAVPLKKGALFSKGDVLLVVYPDETALALRARKSQYQNALANLLPDLAIDFPGSEAVFRNFFVSIDISSPLPPFPEVTDEKLRIFLASRNVLSEYLNIQKDQLQLSRHTIRAPFDGTYTDVYMETGAYINTGAKVADAIRTDMLELEVPLLREDADWVDVGTEVTVHSDRSDFRWKGRVIRKSSFVDMNSQRQSVFVRLENHQDVPLLAGEYLIADFPGHPIDEVMEIPRNAVFNTNEIFSVEKGRLRKRTIHIIKENERTLIFNGLPQGDTIVLQPLINVLEGTLVQVRSGGNGSSAGQAAPLKEDAGKAASAKSPQQ